jgi:hypothetical protein
MPYSLNKNLPDRCPKCGDRLDGLDSHWNRVTHDNLACRWLGKTVVFTLGEVQLTGEVIETERLHLCNGVHDILTVEVWDRDRQIKIQAHRQSFKRVDA